MGDLHYWTYHGRITCAAIACALALTFCCVVPALATESTVTVDKKDFHEEVSKGLVSAYQVSGSRVDAAPLSLIEPAAGLVEGISPFLGGGEIYDLVMGVGRGKAETLSRAIVGLQRGVRIYVPLSDLFGLIRFPATLDLEKGTFEGSFFRSDNRFSIDINAGTYTVLGESARIPDGAVIVRENSFGGRDIYMTLELMNKIWPLDAEFKFSALELILKTPRKLPYELVADREARRKRLSGEDEESALDLSAVPSGYRMLGPQTIKLADSVLWNGPEKQLTNALSLTGAGDLLGATASYNLNWSSSSRDKFDLSNARISLVRRDYGSDKLLPFGLETAKLGDVSVGNSPVIGAGIRGRGLYVSTETRDTNRDFDEVTIEGTSTPGWEVELYAGKELLEFSYVDERGEYRFENVPLVYGSNDFRIVLYGPQGQLEERTESYSINRRRKRPGAFSFEGALIEQGRPVFNVTDRDYDDVPTGRFLRSDFGLNRWASGFATFREVPYGGEMQRYVSAGAAFEAIGGVGQFTAFKQLKKGHGFDLRFAREVLGVKANLTSSVFHDFESTTIGEGDNARTFDGELRLSKGYDLPFAGLNLSGGVQYTARKNTDNNAANISFNQSLTFQSFNLGHGLATRLRGDQHDYTTGGFNLSKRLTKDLNLSAALGYQVFPETKLDDGRISLNYRGDTLKAKVAASQGINDSDNSTASANVSYDFGRFLAGLNWNWVRGEGSRVGFTANTTFGPDVDGAYYASTKQGARQTSLKVHLYEDMDFDGVFSPGDFPVEGVRVRVNKRFSDYSDEHGFIDMPKAGKVGQASVVLDTERIKNVHSLLRPARDGYSVMLREGTKPFINMPLYQTGAIDGTVRLSERGRRVPGLKVQLLDIHGSVVQETKTLFDGFYVFEFVRPGTYYVRLAPQYQFNVPPITVSVSSERLFAYGVDILLGQVSEDIVTDNDLVVRDGGRVAHTLHAPVAVGTLKPAPTTSDRPSYTAIRAVRIGEHPYKVRLVLDLSGPSVYSINTEMSGQIINIDLQSTAWDVSKDWQFMKDHPIFKDIQAFALPDGSGTRLRLEAKNRARVFYNSQIPAENGLPDRIYLDFLNRK